MQPIWRDVSERSKKIAVILLLLAVSVVAAVHWRVSLSVAFWKTFGISYGVLLMPPADVADNFAIAEYFFSSPHYNLARAERFYKRTAEMDPAYPNVNLQLARIAFVEGRLTEAAHHATAELELNPKNAKAYYARGLVYGYSKAHARAEQDFLTFLKLVPESWAAHNDLAFVYFQAGEFEKAAAIAREGLVLSPSNPWLHNALGVAELNLGNRTSALEHFRQAKNEFERMTPDHWGLAYPGNDPRLYGGGMAAVLASVDSNIALLAGDTVIHTKPQ